MERFSSVVDLPGTSNDQSGCYRAGELVVGVEKFKSPVRSPPNLIGAAQRNPGEHRIPRFMR